MAKNSWYAFLTLNKHNTKDLAIKTSTRPKISKKLAENQLFTLPLSPSGVQKGGGSCDEKNLPPITVGPLTTFWTFQLNATYTNKIEINCSYPPKSLHRLVLLESEFDAHEIFHSQ